MQGLQGWFLSRVGSFPVDKKKPSLVSMRYSVDLLIAGNQLVLFPEGRINRRSKPLRLEKGLIRLSQLAYKNGVDVQVVPVGLAYSEIRPRLCGSAAICFGKPIKISKVGRKAAEEFDSELLSKMRWAEEEALIAVGRFS